MGSNDTSNSNPAGFTIGNNTVPGQQGGMSVAQGGQSFDLGQWLQNVGQQINTPQQGGNTQGGMSVGGQLPPAHQAVMQGLTDGLKTGAKNLASTNPQAAAGLLAQITGNSNNPNSPMPQMNQQQLPTKQVQQGQQVSPQELSPMNPKTGQPSDINQANDPLMNTVQNQANDTLTRKNSFLENLIPGLRSAHDVNKLGRLTMAAGIGEKRALVDYQNLKNMGQEPVQPEQYMTAYAGMYQKTIDGLSQVATTAATGQEAGTKLFQETADNTRNAFQKMMAQPSESSSAALTAAVGQQKAQAAAVMDFHDYIKNNPISKVMDNIKNNLPKAGNKDAQASAMGQKIGKYTLVK